MRFYLKRLFSTSIDQLASHYKMNRSTKVVYTQLQHYQAKYNEMNRQLTDPTLAPAELQKIRDNIDFATQMSSLYNKLTSQLQVLIDTQEIMQEPTTDKELSLMLESEAQQALQLIEDYQNQALKLIIQPEKYDEIDIAYAEFRPGVGGGESMIFAEEMMTSIEAYCINEGWRVQRIVCNKETGISKGIKLGILKVQGPQSYLKLRCESGVHKVIRVPETESKGRLHSSTMQLIIQPEIPFTFQLNEKDLKFEYCRSQGAGG